MSALPKAIIHTPTEDEALRFLEFAKEYGYYFPDYKNHGSTAWTENAEDTCYDTEATEICYCEMQWYQDHKDESFWPDDPRLEFCTVDEFIRHVTGDNPEEAPIDGVIDLLP